MPRGLDLSATSQNYPARVQDLLPRSDDRVAEVAELPVAAVRLRLMLGNLSIDVGLLLIPKLLEGLKCVELEPVHPGHLFAPEVLANRITAEGTQLLRGVTDVVLVGAQAAHLVERWDDFGENRQVRLDGRFR